MDYSVPEIDKVLEEGLNDVGAVYEVARAIKRQWEHLEEFDDRALIIVKDSLEYLRKIQLLMQNLLDDNGQYNWSDEKDN